MVIAQNNLTKKGSLEFNAVKGTLLSGKGRRLQTSAKKELQYRRKPTQVEIWNN